jgi:hypothetical protein
MVEVPDTGLLVAVAVGVLGFFYFIVKRKDDNKNANRVNVRSDEESELGKEELARKVKKELTDEAEKVEKIRKDVAVDVKQETNAVTDQKLKEQKADFDHKLELYEERNHAKFTAMDKVNDDLLSKIVDTARDQTGALLKINDTMEYFRKLLNEMGNKVNRVEKEQDKQEYRE